VLSRGEELLAHETVQTVFIIAAAKLRRIEGEEHLWNWLARVARQQIAKAWRQRQRDSGVVGVADLPECADSGNSERLLEEKLDGAMLGLDAEERQLIEWHYFDGQSHGQIAERLAATSKAVSGRLERARAKLRSLLAGKLSHDT